jgi:tetratricopeptide (TPR) repeat protein
MRILPGTAISSAFLAFFLSALLARSGRGQETQVEGLRAAAHSHPGDLDAALSLARALRRAGRSNEAENELHRAAGFAGSSPKALAAIDVDLALVYIDRGDFARAFATCGKVVTLTGAAAQGHVCVASAHLLQQRASEALVETSQALAKDPACYEAYVAEGRAYDLELDSSRAEASLREALKLRANGADAHLALGRALWAEGKKEEGIAEVRTAADLDPSDPETCFELAMMVPPGPERTHLLEQATLERPSFAKAWVALGAERLQAGRVSDAKDAAEAATKAFPGNVDARLLLGQVALTEGRVDDAVRAGQEVLRSFPNSAAAQLLIGDGDARKGELDLALEAYQAAWGLDHGKPTALVHASVACHAGGRDTSARAFGVRATQEFPDWAPGWDALGDALVSQGDKQGARDAYSKALSVRGGDVDRDAVRRKLASIQ